MFVQMLKSEAKVSKSKAKKLFFFKNGFKSDFCFEIIAVRFIYLAHSYAVF